MKSNASSNSHNLANHMKSSNVLNGNNGYSSIKGTQFHCYFYFIYDPNYKHKLHHFNIGYHSDTQSTDPNLVNYRRNCGVPVTYFEAQSAGTTNRYSIHQNGKSEIIRLATNYSNYSPYRVDCITDIYDPEITTCCLPPPSPAPNNDRFVGMPPPNQQQQQQHQHQQQQQRQQIQSLQNQK